MRINKLWKVWKWAPIPSAMSRMIRELKQRTESGFLGASSYFGGLRQPTLVQYWRSFEQLESYARMPATGLGAAARIVPAAGRKATSAGRAGVRSRGLTPQETPLSTGAARRCGAAPRSRSSWRSGEMRTTFLATPSFSSAVITSAEGSSSQRRRPWAAERGKA